MKLKKAFYEQNLFKNFKSKKIIVIGNRFIDNDISLDSYDIVIRFNNYDKRIDNLKDNKTTHVYFNAQLSLDDFLENKIFVNF